MKQIQVLLFTGIILSGMFINSASAQYLPLYKKIPNFIEAPNNEVETTTAGILRISKVSVPGYQFFSAGSDGTKPCVVICPGGGYGILAASHEGTDVAKYFNSIGVHALVLKYRIPSDANQQEKEWAPLQDAQQAIHLVRKNAKKWNVDPTKVGIMGFSAGGHLASTLATHYDDRKIKAKSSISFRPDFQILIYPVISFGKFAHKGSRNNLLSPDTTAEKIAYFSNELHINKQSPPAFLVHAKDDKAVPVENSLIYAQQLKDNEVEAEVFLYEAGGHGFGMKNSTSAAKWTDSLKSWLEKNSILK
jgi:acetyl esterase/lipase